MSPEVQSSSAQLIGRSGNASQGWTMDQWISTHRDDPRIPEMHDLLVRWRQAHLHCGRRYLGWGILSFAELAGPSYRETDEHHWPWGKPSLAAPAWHMELTVSARSVLPPR